MDSQSRDGNYIVWKRCVSAGSRSRPDNSGNIAGEIDCPRERELHGTCFKDADRNVPELGA